MVVFFVIRLWEVQDRICMLQSCALSTCCSRRWILLWARTNICRATFNVHNRWADRVHSNIINNVSMCVCVSGVCRVAKDCALVRRRGAAVSIRRQRLRVHCCVGRARRCSRRRCVSCGQVRHDDSSGVAETVRIGHYWCVVCVWWLYVFWLNTLNEYRCHNRSSVLWWCWCIFKTRLYVNVSYQSQLDNQFVYFFNFNNFNAISVVGDAVNLAARLMARAAVGDVLVDGDTERVIFKQSKKMFFWYWLFFKKKKKNSWLARKLCILLWNPSESKVANKYVCRNCIIVVLSWWVCCLR